MVFYYLIKVILFSKDYGDTMTNEEIDLILREGKSHIAIEYKDGYVVKEFKNKNFVYLEILNKLNKMGFWFIPKFKKIDPNFIMYEFIDGKPYKREQKIKKSNIKLLAQMLRAITDVLLEGENNVYYAHGDINPTNLVFNNDDELIGIVDWDSIHVTDNLNEDLFHTMWTCLNISNFKKSIKKKLKMIKLFLKKYGYEVKGESDKIVNNFYKVLEQERKKIESNNNLENNDKLEKINQTIEYIKFYEEEISKLDSYFAK